jgi:hypothetical protein
MLRPADTFMQQSKQYTLDGQTQLSTQTQKLSYNRYTENWQTPSKQHSHNKKQTRKKETTEQDKIQQTHPNGMSTK